MYFIRCSRCIIETVMLLCLVCSGHTSCAFWTPKFFLNNYTCVPARVCVCACVRVSSFYVPNTVL